jgi:hypothetical protein
MLEICMSGLTRGRAVSEATHPLSTLSFFCGKWFEKWMKANRVGLNLQLISCLGFASMDLPKNYVSAPQRGAFGGCGLGGC